MTTYKEAGVDIQAGDEAVKKIKSKVKSTFSNNVLLDIGGFGGAFKFPSEEYEEPILVSSVDGVGTKLKIAFMSAVHDTIGQCLVNHCTNDILVLGAKPLFFLDYFATDKLRTDVFESVVSGLSKACIENSCSLIGGETAEMPGFYQENEYDMSGTVVGVVDRKNLLSNRKVESGDVILGLPSTGLHTNGYSLARKVLLDKYKIDEFIPSLNCTISEALLAIHKSYLNILSPIINNPDLHALSHITGGGIIGNISRVIEKNQNITIDWDAWDRPEIFNLIQKEGSVPEDDIRTSMNLGIGLVLIVSKEKVNIFEDYFKSQDEPYYLIGNIT